MSDPDHTDGVKAVLKEAQIKASAMRAIQERVLPNSGAYGDAGARADELEFGIGRLEVVVEAMRRLEEYDTIIEELAEGFEQKRDGDQLIALGRAAVALLLPPYNGLSDENKRTKVRQDMLFVMSIKLEKGTVQ